MHKQRTGTRAKPATGVVSPEIEGELLVERGVVVLADAQTRMVCVGRRLIRFGRDVAAGARLVLDHELLTETLGEMRSDQPRQNVGRSAGRKADQQAHRPGRVVGGSGRRAPEHDTGER